jgi:hypothetical protein
MGHGAAGTVTSSWMIVFNSHNKRTPLFKWGCFSIFTMSLYSQKTTRSESPEVCRRSFHLVLSPYIPVSYDESYANNTFYTASS